MRCCARLQRAIAALDPLDRADLWTNHDSYAGTVNMPRIEYAYNVVKDGRVPASAPGDLQDTGQVGEAQSYLAHRPYLTFTNDLTGLLPTNNSGAATLSNGDFESVAVALGVEVAAIQAVAQVEAGGRHGLSGGRPIIRYELHIFHRQTRGIYDRSHPHLSQPSLGAGNPYHRGGQANEWSLLLGAMILRDSRRQRRTSEAWQSASWGMFQVMGFNFNTVGWSSINDFVRDMFQSEGQQLRAFAGYVRNAGLARSLSTHNWAGFARGYNGASYQVNHYDQHMAAAYATISQQRRTAHLSP